MFAIGTASSVASIVSCTSSPDVVDDPSGGDASDASIQHDAGVADAPPVTDAHSIGDAPSDASDANVPAAACASFAPLLCNFNGVCPPFSGMGIQPPGLSDLPADGGLDGSTAYRAYLVNDAGFAGGAYFGMPFQEPNPNGPTPAITACRVICSANLRVASASSSTVAVVKGADDSFALSSLDGGWVLTAPDASAPLPGMPVSPDWVHATFVLSPSDGGGASSTVTLEAGDASATASVGVTKLGQLMRFGAFAQSGEPPVIVYVDDVACRITD